MTRTPLVAVVSLVLTAAAGLIHPLLCAVVALVSVVAILASIRRAAP